MGSLDNSSISIGIINIQCLHTWCTIFRLDTGLFRWNNSGYLWGHILFVENKFCRSRFQIAFYKDVDRLGHILIVKNRTPDRFRLEYNLGNTAPSKKPDNHMGIHPVQIQKQGFQKSRFAHIVSAPNEGNPAHFRNCQFFETLEIRDFGFRDHFLPPYNLLCAYLQYPTTLIESTTSIVGYFISVNSIPKPSSCRFIRPFSPYGAEIVTVIGRPLSGSMSRFVTS